MDIDDIKKRLKTLSDLEIQESVVLKESDFQPGVYDLYVHEAKNRGINIQKEMKKNEECMRLVSAPAWKRFINYIIDSLLFYFFINIVFFYPVRNNLFSPVYAVLIGIIFFIAYIIICEFKFGKTLGKLITGTRVITKDGNLPKLRSIIMRAFSRFIPFNSWVTLFTGLSLHDRTSETRCVEDKLLKDIALNPVHSDSSSNII